MDPLLQPFKLRHLQLRNRIVSTAHVPNLVDENNHPGERYRRYHEEKAKGGLALTIIGGSSTVSPDSPSLWGQINLSTDGVIEPMAKLADAVHVAGAAVFCQVTHMGRRTVDNDGDFLPVIAPSNVRERLHRAFPKAMELHDIVRVMGDFVSAARRCKRAGLDGIELLAFGHLLGQFMSPAVNMRSDEYGGSLVNRLRFPIEVLQAVRGAVGEDFVIGMRIAGDEETERGMNVDECAKAARYLAETGLLDYFNVNLGIPDTEAGFEKWIPGMGVNTASNLSAAGSIRVASGLPVFYAGGITDLPSARHMVRNGLADMVGMTRAHIADPHLVNKLIRGEEDNIRPCVGTGFSIDRVSAGMKVACTHNVSTGRETQFGHEIDASNQPGKKVVVIGGGPGGMEAARVSALRGHNVVLLEATESLGGQLILAGKPLRRRQMLSIIDWLRDELGRLGVAVHHNVFAGVDEVVAEAPDVVVVATGGLPSTDIVPEGGELLLSVWDVLSGEVRPRGDVLIYDDRGNHQGLSCAEFLSELDANVELVTPDRAPGHEIGIANRPTYMRNLYAKGVRFTPDTTLCAVRRSGNRLEAHLANEYSGASETRHIDHVIVENGVVPNDDLFFELVPKSRNLGQLDLEALRHNQPQRISVNAEGQFTLFRVGDAVSSRNVHSAMFDAHRVCRVL